MMSREHHRRRSPESSRRRRKERRDSREQLQSQPIPTSIPSYQESFQQPSYQQSNRPPYREPSHEPYHQPYHQSPYQPSYQQPHQEPDRVSYQPQPSEVRDRAFSTSSSSSSTSSSLLNISQPSRKFGIGTFFSGGARKQHRRVRKKRSRFLRLGNSSSSSVGSDLAYGKGYIDRYRSRDFSPPSGQKPPRRDTEPKRPRPPKRAQTDEEIIELGRKFAEIARQQNAEDLRASGTTRPSTLVGAAAALKQFHRTNSGKSSRGIGNSKPLQESSPDDSDWESASSDDESSEDDADYGLAYGSSHHLPSHSGRPPHLDASAQSAQTYSHNIPLNRKPSLVDPKLFGPVNSLRGFVQTPCGFDRVDRDTVGDARQRYDPPTAHSETVVSTESRPLQHVYPVPTSDPSRFDAGRGSIVSSHQDLNPSSRPDPVPIQQPKPITPVHTKVFESVDTDPRYSKRSSGSALAQTTEAGLAGAAVGAAMSSDAAIGELLRSAQKENRVEYGDAHADDIKHQSKRSSDEVYDGKFERNDRNVLRDVPSEKRQEPEPPATRGDGKEKRRREKRESGSDRDLERERHRRDKYRDDLGRTEKAERREGESGEGQETSQSEGRREEHGVDQFASRDKYHHDSDRTAKIEQREDALRDDQKVSRKESRREKHGEDRSFTREPIDDTPTLAGRPGFEPSKGAIDPFQYQVADDAFPTPRYGTPKRPLTPIVMTVEREPDFSSFEPYEPHERLSRKDSFERELRDAQKVYDAAGQATVPISKAAFAAAAAAELARERHERSPKRSPKRDSSSQNHSQRPSSSPQSRDPVLTDADRAYREARLARRIREQEERSRSNSPDSSVVDKWKDDKDSAASPQIVTPPAMDHPKQQSPYDGPDADVRIDNVLEHPKELSRFRISGSRHRASTIPVFSARDPSAERERPLLNLVRPTPAHSPAPEKQQSKTAEVSSPTTRVDTDSVSISTHGEVVSAPSTPTSKAVSWGKNETKHYVVESPVREDDPYSGAKIITPARSRSGKKGGGGGAIAAAISGVGVGVVASSISSPAANTDTTRRQDERGDYEPSSKRRSSSQFDAPYDNPPIPGPKPPSLRSFQIPGAFAEDPAFMANIAAGLEGSGFDPNIIINDANFHRRDSPPGSNEPLGLSGIVSSRASSGNGQDRSDTGFVIGELPDTPSDEREIPHDSTEISSTFNKTEWRRQEKTANKEALDKSVLVLNDDVATERPYSVTEEAWSAPVSQLSKKEQKKRAKAAKAEAWEDDKVLEGAFASEQEPEPVIDEWEDMPSKKKKSKKLKKAIVVQQGPIQGQHEPQRATIIETSEFSAPVDAYRDLHDVKVAEPEYSWTIVKDAMGSEGPSGIHDWDADLASTSQGSRQMADDHTVPVLEDEWSMPSKDKRKKKAKRDIAAENSLPSLITASELSRESSYNIIEEAQAIPLPTDQWDLPKNSEKKKRNSTGAGSFTHSTEAVETPEELIMSQTAGEVSKSVRRDESVDNRDLLENLPKSRSHPSPSRHVSVVGDIVESPKDISESVSDLRSEKTATTEERDLPKKAKKKKKSKRDSTAYEEFLSRSDFQSAVPSETSIETSKKSKERSPTDSPFRAAPASELGFEGDQKGSKKEKRRSTPGGFPDDDDFLIEGVLTERERDQFKFEDNDVSSVVSDPNRYDGHRSNRNSGRAEDHDDGKSVASAPDGTSRNSSKSSKDKREGGSSSLFDRLKSSIGISERKEQSRKEANDKDSFLDNAGTLGASAGVRGAAIALALQEPPEKAKDTAPGTGSSQESESLERLPSPSPRTEFIDPEIVEREIRPAIDPTYGDLLPLPPSRSGSPVPVLDDNIPPLPESRPGTPEDERERLLLANKPTHVRRRSDTPLRVKTRSQSAIPIQFRLGQRTAPASPGIVKSSPVASPITGTPETSSASKARARPMSWESTRAFKPLLLVEKTSRELVVTPTSRHEELHPSDIPDGVLDDFYTNTGHTLAPLDDLHDGPLVQEAHRVESPQLPPPVEEPQSPIPNPDAVDPVSKNRSSYLLYSSPPAAQNSKDTDTSEVSPTLRCAEVEVTLDDLKEVVFNDIPSDELLVAAAAAAGSATSALVANALGSDYNNSQAMAVGTNDNTTSEVPPLDESTGLVETIDTTETGAKDIEPDELRFASGKKSKKSKKGKSKSRDMEPVAEASNKVETSTSTETPADCEVALDGGNLELPVKNEEKDDGFAAVKLPKKDNKGKKKKQVMEAAMDDSTIVEAPLPLDEQEDEFFDAAAEQLIVEPEAQEVDTGAFADALIETPVSEEPVVMTKKGKKKKRKSQTWDTSTEDQSPVFIADGNDVDEPPLLASKEESIAFDNPILTHDDTAMEREAPSTSTVSECPPSISKKGKKNKGKKAVAWDEEEATTAPSLEVTTSAEQIPPMNGAEVLHIVAGEIPETNSERAQSSHAETEAGPIGPNQDTPKEITQVAPTVEDGPSVTSKKSKKKKKGKASQIVEPEPLVEHEGKTDEQAAEGLQQKETGPRAFQIPDDNGNVVEAIFSEQIVKARTESPLDAAAEVTEPCPATPPKAPQLPSNIVEPAIAEVEPVLEEQRLEAGDSERDPLVQANRHDLENLVIHPVEASQSPGPDDVDKSLLKPDELGGVETEQGPAPTDAAKDPLTESVAEDSRGNSAQSLEAVEPPSSFLGTVSEAQISPLVQLTSEEPDKTMDWLDESQTKKKGKKNKKKQQTALDLFDVQETVPILPQVDVVRDQPVEDALLTKQTLSDAISLDDAAAHQEQAETPSDETWLGSVGSSKKSKKGKKSKKIIPEPDIGGTEEAVESPKPENQISVDKEDVVGPEKLSATLQAELNPDDAWAESTISALAKKSKKKGKKNRPNADPIPPIEENGSSPVEPDLGITENSAEAVQEESEPSVPSGTEVDLPVEREIPEAGSEVEAIPDKKKSKNDKENHESSRFDLGNNDTIYEGQDTTIGQQDADAGMPLSDTANPSIDLAVDNTDPDATQATDNTDGLWPTSKRSKKNKDQQSQVLAESENVSAHPNTDLQAVPDLKAISDSPEQEQVREDERDSALTFMSNKKSKKDKKKKRQSVQFAEPIEESREIPAEVTGGTAASEMMAEPDQISFGPPEPTTPIDPASLLVDAPDNLEQPRDEDALQDSTAIQPLDSESSTVSLLDNAEPTDTPQEELGGLEPLSDRLEDEHIASEQQQTGVTAMANQITDLQLQNDINNPVQGQPQNEPEVPKPVDSQIEVFGPDTTCVTPVETVGFIVPDEQLLAEATPVTENSFPAAAEQEYTVGGKKSKKEKKKRKGKAQDNQESALEFPALAPAIETGNSMEKNTEIALVSSPNEPEVEQNEPLQSKEQVTIEQQALDDEFPDFGTKKSKKGKQKGKKDSKVLETAPTLASAILPSSATDTEAQPQEDLVESLQSAVEQVAEPGVEVSDTSKLPTDQQDLPLGEPLVILASTATDEQNRSSQDEPSGPAAVQPENLSIPLTDATANNLNTEEVVASSTLESEQYDEAEASKEQSSNLTLGRKSKKDKKKKKRDSQLQADELDTVQSAGTEPTPNVQIPVIEVQETTLGTSTEILENQAVTAQDIEETTRKPLLETSEDLPVPPQHVEDNAQEMNPSYREVEPASVKPTTSVGVEGPIDLGKASELSSDPLPAVDKDIAETDGMTSNKKNKKDKKKKQANTWDDEPSAPSGPEPTTPQQQELTPEFSLPLLTSEATDPSILDSLEESKEDDVTDSVSTKKAKKNKKKKKLADPPVEEAASELQPDAAQANPDSSEQNVADFSTELGNSSAEVSSKVGDTPQAEEATKTDDTFNSASTKRSEKDNGKEKQTISWEAEMTLENNQISADPVETELEQSDVVTTMPAEIPEDKDFMVSDNPADVGATRAETPSDPMPDSQPSDDLPSTKKSKKNKKKKNKTTSGEEEVTLEDNQSPAALETVEAEHADATATTADQMLGDQEIAVGSTSMDELATQDKTVPADDGTPIDDSSPNDDNFPADNSAAQHEITPENEIVAIDDNALQDMPMPDSQPLDEVVSTKKSKKDKKKKRQSRSGEGNLPQDDPVEGTIEAIAVDLGEPVVEEATLQEPSNDENFTDSAPAKQSKKDEKKQSSTSEDDFPGDYRVEENTNVTANDPTEPVGNEMPAQEPPNDDNLTDFFPTKKSKKEKKKQKQFTSWTDGTPKETPEEMPTEGSSPTAANDVTESVVEPPREIPVEDSIPTIIGDLVEPIEERSPVVEPPNDDALADFMPSKKSKKDKKKKKGISWDQEIPEAKLTETSITLTASDVIDLAVDEMPTSELSVSEPSAPEPSVPEPAAPESSHTDDFAESTPAKKSKKEKKKKKSNSWDDEVPEENPIENLAGNMANPVLNDPPALESSNDVDLAVITPTKKSKKDKKRRKDITRDEEVAEEKPIQDSATADPEVLTDAVINETPALEPPYGDGVGKSSLTRVSEDKTEEQKSSLDNKALEKITEDLATTATCDLIDPVVSGPLAPEPSIDEGVFEVTSTKKSKKDKKKKKAGSWEDGITQEELPKEAPLQESTSQEGPLLENTLKEESPTVGPSQEELPQADPFEVTQDTPAPEELGQLTLPQEVVTEPSAVHTSVIELGEPTIDNVPGLDDPLEAILADSAPTKKSKKDKKKKKQVTSSKVDSTPQEEAEQPKESQPLAEGGLVPKDGLSTEGEVSAVVPPDGTKEEILDDFSDFTPTQKSKKGKKHKKQENASEVDSTHQENSIQDEEIDFPAEEDTVPENRLPTVGEALAATIPDEVKVDDLIDPSPMKRSKEDKRNKKQFSSLEVNSMPQDESICHEETLLPASETRLPAEADNTFEDGLLAEGEAPAVTMPDDVKVENLAVLAPTKKSKKDKKKKKQALLEAGLLEEPSEASEDATLVAFPDSNEQVGIEVVLPDASGDTETMESPSMKKAKKDKKKKNIGPPEDDTIFQPELQEEPNVSIEMSAASEQTTVEPLATGEVSQSKELPEFPLGKKSKKDKKKKRTSTQEFAAEPETQPGDRPELAAEPAGTSEPMEIQSSSLPTEQSSIQVTEEINVVPQGVGTPSQEEAAGTPRHSGGSVPVAEPSSTEDNSAFIKPDDAKELDIQLELGSTVTKASAEDATKKVLAEEMLATPQPADDEPSLKEITLETGPVIDPDSLPPLQDPETVQLEEAAPDVVKEVDATSSKKSKKDKKKKKRASQVSWEPEPEAEIGDIPEQQRSEQAFDEQPMISEPTEMDNSTEVVRDVSSEFASGKESEQKKRQSQMDWEPEPNSETPFEEPNPLPPTKEEQNTDMLLDHQSLAEGTETSLKDSTNLDDTFPETTSRKKSKKNKKKASQQDWETEPATTTITETEADPLLAEQIVTEYPLKPDDAPSPEAIETKPEDGENTENTFPEIVPTKKSKKDKRKTRKQAATEYIEPEVDPRQPAASVPDTGDSVPSQAEPQASEDMTPAENSSRSPENSDLPARKDVAEEQSREIIVDEVEAPVDQTQPDDVLGQVQSTAAIAKESELGLAHAEPALNESTDSQDTTTLPDKSEKAFDEMGLVTRADIAEDTSQDQPEILPEFRTKNSKKDKKKAKKAQLLETSDEDPKANPSTNLQSWDWSNIGNGPQPEAAVPEGASGPEVSIQIEQHEIVQPSDASHAASQWEAKEASNEDQTDSSKPALTQLEQEFPITRKKSKKDKKRKKDINQSESEPQSGVQTPLAQDTETGDIPQDAGPTDPIIQEADAGEPQDDKWASLGKKQTKKDKKRRKVLSEEIPQELPTVSATIQAPENQEQSSLDVVSGGVENQISKARDVPEADIPPQLQEQVTVPEDAVPSNPVNIPETTEANEPTVPGSRPRTPSPKRQMSVTVDMSPAQLSSHIGHERPFDQSTQPGKKARIDPAEDEAIVPQPLAAMVTELPALTLEASDSQKADTMVIDMPLTSEESIQQAKDEISERMARDIAVTDLDSDSLAVDEIQATPGYEGFQDASLTQARDKAVLTELAPSTSGEEKGQVNEDQGVDTATIVGAGGVVQIAKKFGGSKKGKGKKQSKIVDKRTPNEADILDDSALRESSAPKALKEGFTLDADSGDFRAGLSTEAQGHYNEESQQTTGPAASEEVPRSTEYQDLGAEDVIESPVKGREIVPELAGTYNTKGTGMQLNEASMDAEIQDDWDDLDTSEPPEGHHNKYLHEGARDELQGPFSPSLPPPRTPSALDYGHVSPRSLPPVEEETHEDLEKESLSGLQAKTGMELEVNRDSGVVTETPNPRQHSRGLGDGAGQRDSGVHMRGWAEATSGDGQEAAGSKESRAHATLSNPLDEDSSVQTPQLSERRSRRSLFDSETPKLSTPTQSRGWNRDTTPGKLLGDEPLKRATTPLKSRTVKYQELASSSSAGTPLHTPQHQTQRSVSDNISDINREATPRLESEARRSASNTGISRLQTPEPLKFRPESPGSHSIRSIHSIRSLRSSGANTPPLRRVGRQMSGDLRSLSQSVTATATATATGSTPSLPLPTQDKDKDSISKDSKDSARDASDRHALHHTTPVANEGRVRAKDMTDVYDGYGEGRIGSPRSPTRPPSMRRRQSMQVLELESKVEQLLAENRALADARAHDQKSLNQRNTSAITDRDAEIESLKASLQWLQNEVTRLTEVNEGLQSANSLLAVQHNEKYSRLESQHTTAARELEEHRGARGQYTQTLQQKDAEIQELRNQLEATKEQIREMQKQILAAKPPDAEFLRLRDEDHFDHRCQQLCSHVQQWVLRFSKFSDMRACRLTSEINDEKIIDRLDNTVLDGSDVDDYLSDRVRRRDIFMSMTMNMVWEFVFTRYLFGMDREQRQKLKSLEKLLTEVGPPQAVRQWRAVTLTLLSKRPAFGDQRNQDTEAVVQAILQTLSMILPPPSNLETQIQSQLRRVMREAVDLSIEMRTQRAEYMMLPPLQPEYDASGELKQTVTFNAALMNERSGDSSTTNEAYEAQGAIVRCVLFPLVVKKGDDHGVGDDEIVVSPAQVLVAKARHSTIRMVTPSSDAGGVPLSRGATPSIYGQSTMSLNMQDAPAPPTPDYT